MRLLGYFEIPPGLKALLLSQLTPTLLLTFSSFQMVDMFIKHLLSMICYFECNILKDKVSLKEKNAYVL